MKDKVNCNTYTNSIIINDRVNLLLKAILVVPRLYCYYCTALLTYIIYFKKLRRKTKLGLPMVTIIIYSWSTGLRSYYIYHAIHPNTTLPPHQYDNNGRRV